MDTKEYNRVLEQQANKVYSLFESKNTQFYRTFFIFTAITGFIFVLVFYPYVTMRGTHNVLSDKKIQLNGVLYSNERMNSELHDLIDALYKHDVAVDKKFSEIKFDYEIKYSRHLEHIKRVKYILKGAPEAEDWISGKTVVPKDIRLIRNRYKLEEYTAHLCFWYTDDIWLRCMVRLDINDLHRFSIIPVRNYRGSEIRNQLNKPLAKTLDSLTQEIIKKTGVHKLNYSDGSLMWSNYRKTINGYSKKYKKEFKSHLTDMRSSLSNSKIAVKDVNRKIEINKNKLMELEIKINNMQGLENISTPLGVIPIGLNDLVLLFPVVLFLGLVVYLSQYNKVLMLREMYKKLVQEYDSEHNIYTDKHISIIAELWVDNSQPVTQYLLRWIGLVIPVLLGISSIVLLNSNELLADAFLTQARFEYWIYITLYTLAVISSLFYIWSTYRTVDSHRKSA